ncbi:MAG: 5-formyltetrahydrofolate cyclo-ligase [Actinomycetota bacterium]
MSQSGRTKAEWRAFAQTIAPATVAESELVTLTVREVIKRQDFRVVLTFLAMAGEIDLGGLKEEAGLVLAATRTPQGGPLTIHYLEGPLERHPLGFLQPGSGAAVINPLAIDVVLVPGVLFARDGGRLGHGRGYYDTLLASFHPRPYLIGVSIDRKVVRELPMTDHDIRMDAVATETGFREATP